MRVLLGRPSTKREAGLCVSRFEFHVLVFWRQRGECGSVTLASAAAYEQYLVECFTVVAWVAPLLPFVGNPLPESRVGPCIFPRTWNRATRAV